jgi:exopolyphosphatase/guanosine-5'-triphosphate,3'-diphosphate pyrophosphatase
LYDLVGKTEHDSVRSQAVTALTSRYQVDLEQASRVEQTAVYCFSQLASLWNLDNNENYRQCLIWATRLHEIGLAIAHSKYQKHGEYIVRHSDLLGFTRSEQQIVATLIRAHRYKFPTSELNELGESLIEPVMHLCIMLRIAVLLRRGRRSEHLPEIAMTANDSKIKLVFPDGWLKKHALTRADLKQEKKYLKAVNIRLVFK